jgi:hypothetical protein
MLRGELHNRIDALRVPSKAVRPGRLRKRRGRTSSTYSWMLGKDSVGPVPKG